MLAPNILELTFPYQWWTHRQIEMDNNSEDKTNRNETNNNNNLTHLIWYSNLYISNFVKVSVNKACIEVDCDRVLGVPAELSAQGPAGRGEGSVKGRTTVGGSENPDRPETQTEGGQTSGTVHVRVPVCVCVRP